MRAVGKPIRKKDAQALVAGKPVYTDDLAPKDCLIVKVLRSPHANAKILEVDTSAAEHLPGIEAIYSWEDVPQQRFTLAGQTYPEPSPYDRQRTTLCWCIRKTAGSHSVRWEPIKREIYVPLGRAVREMWKRYWRDAM